MIRRSILAVHPPSGLRRDEITHRVLALCAEGEVITSEQPRGTVGPRLHMRGHLAKGDMQVNLTFALTTLEAAGLIQWFPDRNRPDMRYPSSTATGLNVLGYWDAELLGGTP